MHPGSKPFSDPYIYPGTPVLRNLLGERNHDRPLAADSATTQRTYPHRSVWHASKVPAVVTTTLPRYNYLYVKGCAMKTMSYSESRANYASVLDSVLDDREEVVITRAGKEPVVILSLEDYESLKESAYLMRSPENAARLLRSIKNLEEGRGTRGDMIE